MNKYNYTLEDLKQIKAFTYRGGSYQMKNIGGWTDQAMLDNFNSGIWKITEWKGDHYSIKNFIIARRQDKNSPIIVEDWFIPIINYIPDTTTVNINEVESSISFEKLKTIICI